MLYPSFDILREDYNLMRIEYNKFVNAKIGEQEYPLDEPLIKVRERCEEFEQAHLAEIGQTGSIYTDDEGFPDHFGHANFLYNQAIDVISEQYHIEKGLQALEHAGLINREKRIGGIL
jgi:hypothetical protein